MDKKSIKPSIKSSMLRVGKKTYFFDVKLASNDKRYLKITESRFVNDSGDRKRNSFILFPEDVLNFKQRVEEISGYLAQ